MDFLGEHIIPKLKAVENLVLIGCSPILQDWLGNYWRDRPQNMNMILDYSDKCKSELEYFIDVSKWSEDEIQKFTIDNIHLSPEGFNYIHQLIKAKLSLVFTKEGGR
jgi:hypothetical protein